MTNNVKNHFKGRYLGIKEKQNWEYAYRTNATGVVVMVPVTDAGELVLVEQYRIPVNGRVIELPAGLVGDTSLGDEDFESAARRELLEETGYTAVSLEHLLTSPSTAGMADEMVTIYYAHGLKRVSSGGGDASEDIVVHHVPLHSATLWLDKKIEEGVMLDPKIYAGLFWAQTHGESS